MILDSVRSWGRCTSCGEILWCEDTPQDQSCGCSCGGLFLRNATIVKKKTLDRSFKAEEMEAELQLNGGSMLLQIVEDKLQAELNQ